MRDDGREHDGAGVLLASGLHIVDSGRLPHLVHPCCVCLLSLHYGEDFLGVGCAVLFTGLESFPFSAWWALFFKGDRA